MVLLVEFFGALFSLAISDKTTETTWVAITQAPATPRVSRTPPFKVRCDKTSAPYSANCPPSLVQVARQPHSFVLLRSPMDDTQEHKRTHRAHEEVPVVGNVPAWATKRDSLRLASWRVRRSVCRGARRQERRPAQQMTSAILGSWKIEKPTRFNLGRGATL